MVRPFKRFGTPLADFVREVGKLEGIPISTAGGLDKGIGGKVSLFVPGPIRSEELREIFHRVLASNGFAALDAPNDNGWVIVRIRDARDGAIPLFEMSETPLTSRMVTAHRTLKYVPAEGVARVLRAFMPANSRIVPVGTSQLFVTDAGVNVRRLQGIIVRMDTKEGAAAFGQQKPQPPSPRCGELRLEKLVVEKIEMPETGGKK